MRLEKKVGRPLRTWRAAHQSAGRSDGTNLIAQTNRPAVSCQPSFLPPLWPERSNVLPSCCLRCSRSKMLLCPIQATGDQLKMAKDGGEPTHTHQTFTFTHTHARRLFVSSSLTKQAAHIHAHPHTPFRRLIARLRR
jgi:hypothetical protein